MVGVSTDSDYSAFKEGPSASPSCIKFKAQPHSDVQDNLRGYISIEVLPVSSF